MTLSGWSTGNWGLSPWGSPGAPSLAVIDLGGCDPSDFANVLGGTPATLYGNNFFDPAVVELLQGSLVVGRAEYFEGRLDLRLKKMIVGLPALPAGTYSVRVTTAYGSALLPDAVTYKPFCEQTKVHRVRRRFAPAWATGPRWMT